MTSTRLNAIVILATLVVTAGAAQTSPEPKTWAVVIGVSKYQKLPGGQHLQFADRDAALFAEAIQKRGVSPQNVRLLTGAEATAAAIKSAVGSWLARSAAESDTVLIFFSGHGLFEREFGESYLLGYDSDPKDPYANALSVSELGQALSRRVRAGRVLVIADAVRRDLFDPESDSSSARAFEQAFDRLAGSRPGMSAILASGPEEFSREGQRWGGHGVFTKHLADVLIDGADRSGNVAITTDDLFALLKARVADDTANKQHPWRVGTMLAQIAPAREPQASAKVAEARSEPSAKTPSPGTAVRPSETGKPADAGAAKPASPNQPSKQAADVKPDRDVKTESKLTQQPGANEKKAEPAGAGPSAKRETVAPAAASEKKADAITTVSDKRAGPASIPANEKKIEPATVAGEKKAEASTATRSEKNEELAARNVGGKVPPGAAEPRPTATSGNTVANPTQPAPVKTPSRAPAPPAIETVRATQQAPSREVARSEIAVADVPAAPRPTVNPPSSVAVSSERGSGQPETISAPIPAARPDAAPSPLVLQLEAAIASKNLIEPKNASAWDFYQRLGSEPGTAGDAARLKPMLAEALAAGGRLIASGDVRGDNISDKVDDFKRAGQMLARARTLAPEKTDVIALEKLCAAEALIALQFYDEAERALTPLQTAKLASVENALGLVSQGKLDAWRAERAFKRAIELDQKWAAPHYNLALLYRSQQNPASLAEFEAASALDPNSVSLLTVLGEEYFTRQQWKQAADTFRRAVALKPSDDTLHTKLGHALYSQGLQDEANREYQKARELRSKQP